MSKLKVIQINIVVFLLLLLILEIVFRILGFGYGNAPHESDPIFHHVNPRSYSYECYTPSGEYGGHIVSYDDNRRRVSENPKEKKGKEEVWFMGDSFTEAMQLSWDNSFVGIIDSQIDHKVVNIGVSSYSPLLYLLQLKHHLKKPKTIFIQIYSNDVSDDEKYMKLAEFDPQGEPIACNGGPNNAFKTLARKSYLARVIRRTQITIQFLMDQKQSDKESVIQLDKHIERSPELEESSDFIIHIRKLYSLLSSTETKFYFLVIPSKYACVSGDWDTPTFSSRFTEFLQENNYPYIDLMNSFQQASRSQKVFYDVDIHCNAFGNKLIAQEIMTKLKN